MDGCRSCVQAGHAIFPRAIYSGGVKAKVMIIGQAPGITEREAGRPFNAGSGTRLFQWLAAAGFDEAHFRATQYMTAVTKCYPGKSKGGGDRVPSRAEQALCRPYLDLEIDLVDPKLIIPVGRLAIEFVVRRTAGKAPVELRTTPSGRMRVAIPELVALDLVRYPAKAAGWDNVATVLGDLAPSLRRAGMRDALAVAPATPELQRLGHLLERAGAASVLAALETELATRRIGWVPLIPGESGAFSTAGRDPRWRVLVDAEPEAD